MEEQGIWLRVGSRIAWLDVITALAEDLAVAAGLDEDARFAVSMALREAVSNAMVHGNRREEGKLVDVRFVLHADRLELRVHDEGPGFDPSELPDPTLPQNRMRASGRGVFLMRNYMDEVDLSAVSKPGGEVRMFKDLPAAGGSLPRPAAVKT